MRALCKCEHIGLQEMKNVIFIAIILLLSSSVFAADGEVTYTNSNDAQILEAMSLARKTYPEMVAASKKEPSAKVLLKVYFYDKGSEMNGEHIWVQPSDVQAMRGTVISRPVSLKSVKVGDNVSFELHELSDWLLVSGGKAKGAFTVNLLRSRMSLKERAQHDAAYPFSFE